MSQKSDKFHTMQMELMDIVKNMPPKEGVVFYATWFHFTKSAFGPETIRDLYAPEMSDDRLQEIIKQVKKLINKYK